MSAQGYTNKRRLTADAINSTYRREYCGTKVPKNESIILTPQEQFDFGLNTSSFFFVINRNSDPGTRFRYSSITRLYTRVSGGTTFNSNNIDTQYLWGFIGIHGFIGLPIYNRDICIGILNNIFSSYLSTNLINGVRYTLQASLDSEYHLRLTLTPPVPVQTPDALRYIGLFFGNGPTNGSANLGVTPSRIGRNEGVTGSAFMLDYDPTQAGNASQTIIAPYVFLDFIPRE